MAIPALKAAIFIADATSTAPGVYLSAKSTTATCSPGTFMKANSPIRMTVPMPNTVNPAVKLRINKIMLWMINI
ncbi:hypothetical protein BsIDN1_53030 [Bacillus safensis]|uniref:Uncharacterized protein n=1 Tax=Bacillus safensis TaxID=561879 RepID=A0A5S9MFZ0_BACIA|nr:hypothetical protein BsIDN1_53030 [Bacillus safensis]